MTNEAKFSAEFIFLTPDDLLECNIPDEFYSSYEINVKDKSGLVFPIEFISRDRSVIPSSLYPRVRITNDVFQPDEEAARLKTFESAATELRALMGGTSFPTRFIGKGKYIEQEALIYFLGANEQKPFKTKSETIQFITDRLLTHGRFKLTNSYSAFFTGITLAEIEASNIKGFHWYKGVNLEDHSEIDLKRIALNLNLSKGRDYF